MRVLIGKDFPEFRTRFHFFHQHVLKSAVNMVLDTKTKPGGIYGLRSQLDYAAVGSILWTDGAGNRDDVCFHPLFDDWAQTIQPFLHHLDECVFGWIFDRASDDARKDFHLLE